MELHLSPIKNYFKNYTDISSSCWQGIILSFIESTLMGVFYFFTIYFVNILHLSIPITGQIISSYGVGAILGGYVSGKLSDKISPLKVSSFSLLLQAFCYLALILINHPILLMMNVFILGIAAYGFVTANHTHILNICKGDESQKIKVINLLATASNLGLGISGIYVGYMSKYGFKEIFLFTAILLIGLFLYLLFYQIYSIKIIPKELDFKKITCDRNLNNNKRVTWIVLLSVLFVGSIVSQLSSTYSIYIAATFPNMGIDAVTILFTLNSIIVVLFATPIGNHFESKNKIITLGLGGFLIGFGMFILSFSYIFIIAICSCIIYTIGEIIFFCMAQLICYQKADDKNKGESLGMFRMTYATSRVIGPIVGGNLYHFAGGKLIWYLCGIIGLLCLIGCNQYKQEY